MRAAAKRKPREEPQYEASDYAKAMVEKALNSEHGVAPLLNWIGMLEHSAFVAPIAKSSQLIQAGVDRGLDDGFVTGWGARAMIDIARQYPNLSDAEQAVLVEAAKANARVLVEEHNAKKRAAR